MKRIFIVVVALVSTLLSCKKATVSSSADCFSGEKTVRTISNQSAVIKGSDGNYFIIPDQHPDNTAYDLLRPCSLPAEFSVNDLAVIISGDVKATLNTAFGPCCVEDFVISKISKDKIGQR